MTNHLHQVTTASHVQRLGEQTPNKWLGLGLMSMSVALVGVMLIKEVKDLFPSAPRYVRPDQHGFFHPVAANDNQNREWHKLNHQLDHHKSQHAK